MQNVALVQSKVLHPSITDEQFRVHFESDCTLLSHNPKADLSIGVKTLIYLLSQTHSVP